jgi:large subunit ribosomal protein L4
MKVTLYDQSGKKKGDIALDKALFEVEASEGLIHEYLVYQQANARNTIAHVKNRSEVRGGGRKMFKQKGTGNARQGGRRNVHMRGGGSAFGPKKWNTYTKMMPKKMRRKALLGLLSNKAKDGKIIALDKFELDAPKTQVFASLVAALPVVRNVLVVVNREEDMLRSSSKNFKNAKTITSGYLNPQDLLKYDNVLFTETALKDIEATYSK